MPFRFRSVWSRQAYFMKRTFFIKTCLNLGKGSSLGQNTQFENCEKSPIVLHCLTPKTFRQLYKKKVVIFVK